MKKRMSEWTEKMAIILIAIALLATPILAANDPGHDSLYLEQDGNSTLTGSLNITNNLTIQDTLYLSPYLDLEAKDATAPSSINRNTITGTNSLLSIDTFGGLLYLQRIGGGTVFVGTQTAPADLNVTGNIIFRGNFSITNGLNTTINGQNICLENGTGCPGSLGSANVSGTGSEGYLAQWQSTSTINSSIVYQNGSNIGIGLTNPETTLHIAANTTSGNIVYIDNYINSQAGGAGFIRFRRANGTQAAPTITANGDRVGGIIFQAYNGSTFINHASIITAIPATPTGSSMPGAILISTTPVNSTSLVERMRIKEDGTIGIGTATTDALLQISGNASTGLALNVQNTLYVNSTSSAVGIGTTSPSQKLHVTGAANITSSLIVGTLTTASCDVKSDTNGTLYCGTDAGATATIGNLSSVGSTGYIALFNNNTLVNSSTIYQFANYIGINFTSPETVLELGGSLSTDNGNVRHYYDLATFTSTAAAVPGTMQISLPKNYTDTKFQIRVEGYEYNTGYGAWEVKIGGYNYNYHWYNMNAEIIGSAPFKEVRFAENGTHQVILLGNTTTTWARPRIVLAEVITSWTTPGGFGQNWTIYNITDETPIYDIQSATIKTYLDSTGNLGIGSTSPSQKLHVAGAVNITNGITIGTLTTASCDVKSYTNGTLYCGTDAGSATGMISSIISNSTPLEISNGTITNISLNYILLSNRSTFDAANITTGILALARTGSWNQSITIDTNNITSGILALARTGSWNQSITITANNITGGINSAGGWTNTSSSTTTTGNATISGNLTVGLNLTISSLTSANCDIKSDTSGNIYCGTDATGGSQADLANLSGNTTNMIRAYDLTLQNTTYYSTFGKQADLANLSGNTTNMIRAYDLTLQNTTYYSTWMKYTDFSTQNATLVKTTDFNTQNSTYYSTFWKITDGQTQNTTTWDSINSKGNLSSRAATGYIPQMQNSTVVNNSAIYQSVNYIGINLTTPETVLAVSGSISTENGNVRHYYDLATFTSGGAIVTGTMQIALPKNSTDTMLQIRVEGYEYNGGYGAWEVKLGGYNYNYHWYGVTAEITGTAPFKEVRFAENGTHQVILLGNTTTAWSRPKIVVTHVITSFVTPGGFGQNWTIYNITDETPIYDIQSATIKTYLDSSGNLGIGSTSPSQKLHVAGAVNITNGITIGTLTTSSCDVKSYTNGTLYCGTDAGAASGVIASITSNSTPLEISNGTITNITINYALLGNRSTIDAANITTGILALARTGSWNQSITIDTNNITSGILALARTGSWNQSITITANNITGGITTAAGWTNSTTIVYTTDTADNVAIGGTSASHKLTVHGDLNVTTNIVYGGNLTAYGADFAERFTIAEPVNAGDVVCLTESGAVKRCSSRAEKGVVGVVSTNPTIIGNGQAENSVPVGIVGIIPTKVIGPISRFDLITSSAVAGYAEKAKNMDFGAIVGKAMEECKRGMCEINVLVTLR